MTNAHHAVSMRSCVAVLRMSERGWEATEIDRAPDRFVHEIEIGDADGKLETHVAADKQQRVRRCRWKDGSFERDELFTLTKGDITFGLTPCVDTAWLSGN